MAIKKSSPVKELKGFQVYTPPVRNRAIISVEAREKRGKTHFAATAPGPIAFFDFDIGTEGVLGKFTTNKVVYYNEYKVFKAKKGETTPYLALWQKFKQDYTEAVESDLIRTIIIDSATELWEVLRLGTFGKLTQIMPIQYNLVNSQFETTLKMVYGSDKNLVLLHKQKKCYKGSKDRSKEVWTGDFERSGYAHLGFIVQDIYEAYRIDPVKDEEDSTVVFGVRVLDSRHNPYLNGREYEGEFCKFEYVAADLLGCEPEEIL